MNATINILIGTSVALLVVAIGVLIWRTFSTKRLPLLILLFLILPAGQLFMLYSFRFETWSLFWVFGVLLGLLANVSLLIYAMSQEKKTAAQEEIKEAQHKMALEKAYYSAVKNRREHLAEMHKDFGSRLEAASGLVTDGKNADAHKMIDHIAGKVRLARENIYCTIPVVNAVLVEKEKACEELGIELMVNLNIPNPLVVSQMHLCSILSNILDNAINACQKMCVAGAHKPVIRLSSIVDGDYLFIKSTNPSNKPDKMPGIGRGYGLRILADLAMRYGGSFQSNYNEGIFTVVMSLLALESETE